MARWLSRCRRAGPDCSSGIFSSGIFFAAAWFTSPCWRGQAGAPAAAQRRGRTSLRPPSGDGSSEARKIRVRAGCERVVVHPRPGWRSGLASTHPAPRQRAGGCHDHVSGDRAAQSDDRVRRWRRLMPHGRACPGLGDPPVVTAAAAGPLAAATLGQQFAPAPVPRVNIARLRNRTALRVRLGRHVG